MSRSISYSKARPCQYSFSIFLQYQNKFAKIPINQKVREEKLLFRIIQLPKFSGGLNNMVKELEANFRLKVKQDVKGFNENRLTEYHICLVVIDASVTPFIPDFSEVVTDEVEEWTPNGIVIVHDPDNSRIKAIYLFESD